MNVTSQMDTGLRLLSWELEARHLILEVLSDSSVHYNLEGQKKLTHTMG